MRATTEGGVEIGTPDMGVAGEVVATGIILL